MDANTPKCPDCGSTFTIVKDCTATEARQIFVETAEWGDPATFIIRRSKSDVALCNGCENVVEIA